MSIDAKTGLYVIVGSPIKHSKSPEIHNKWFKKYHLNDRYFAFDIDDLKSFTMLMTCLSIKGANITSPYKTRIISMLDEVDSYAKTIGAVNTVWNNSGRLIGFNTDYFALKSILKEHCDFSSKILLLGAGGAARTVAYTCKEMGAEVYVTNRTYLKAKQIAEDFGIIFLKEEELMLYRYDIIINTTSSIIENIYIPSLKNILSVKTSFFFDINYVPKETILLYEAKKLGIPCSNGEVMLLEQAKKSFEIWTGIYPD